MISELELFNFGPFRGRHVIRFGPGAYAVTARHELDSRRSNWIGKSMLLEAIDLALTGRVNKRRGFDADGWITRGEKEGAVMLRLESGAQVMRSKKRGQSRQVRFQLPGGNEAAQDEASAAILKHVGFDADDFRHVVYLEQREAARLIHADPSERLGIIAGWLGIEVAERAEKKASTLAHKRWLDLDRLLERKKVIEDLAPTTEISSIEDLERDLKSQRGMLEFHQRAAATLREVIAGAGIVAEHARKIAEGKVLRAEVESYESHGAPEIALADAEAKLTRLATASTMAATDAARKQRVSIGMFDGVCPVASIACPAKDQINEDRSASRLAYRTAKQLAEQAARDLANAEEEVAPLRRSLRALDLKRAELGRIRAEVRALSERARDARALLLTAFELPPGSTYEAVLAEHEREVTDGRERMRDLEHRIRVFNQRVDANLKRVSETEKVQGEIATASTSHRVAIATRDVFRAARRRVAERALGDVEAMANDALVDAGVDLTVGIRWEREGKDPARECDECGAPFPTTAKVKTCERCGVVRGMHAVQRLDFVLSDSSGAADDLGGITVQLSAGAWFLASRQSPWATAILDEPTSQMDAVVRRGLVRYLGKLVGRGGSYRQLLVISHSSDTIDALPNRIVIVQGADGSRRIEQT